MDAVSTLTAALAGRYLVERQIGAGGMATVYLARDLRHELVRVSAGGAAPLLPLGVRGFRGPRFSPAGRRIIVDVESGGDLVGDIW